MSEEVVHPLKEKLNPNRFSKSKVKNIEIEKIYKSYGGQTEQALRDFFTGKDLHCVKCRVTLPTDTAELVYPVANSLSISLVKADGTRVFGVPYFKCACEYNNSALKLMQQVVTVAFHKDNW